MKKKRVWFLVSALCLLVFLAIGIKIMRNRANHSENGTFQTDENKDGNDDKELTGGIENPTDDKEKEQGELREKERILNKEGMTLEGRFLVPDGYTRVEAESGSLTEFLRSYELKEDNSPVLLYNGKKKGNQSAHAAVFKLPIENENLQQCADSVMRVYAEYFYQKKETEKIAFHFSNGFLAEYEKWRQGSRIKVNGNDVSWVNSASYDDSYEMFRSYLRMVFAYAGTQSMVGESYEIPIDDLAVGDVFLKGGSPGHVVMIVDVCRKEDGKVAFLLAQGYMPAQEFHVLKNPEHKEDPWYYEEELTYPLRTPEYSFEEGSLRRLKYME